MIIMHKLTAQSDETDFERYLPDFCYACIFLYIFLMSTGYKWKERYMNTSGEWNWRLVQYSLCFNCFGFQMKSEWMWISYGYCITIIVTYHSNMTRCSIVWPSGSVMLILMHLFYLSFRNKELFTVIPIESQNLLGENHYDLAECDIKFY